MLLVIILIAVLQKQKVLVWLNFFSVPILSFERGGGVGVGEGVGVGF